MRDKISVNKLLMDVNHVLAILVWASDIVIGNNVINPSFFRLNLQKMCELLNDLSVKCILKEAEKTIGMLFL